MPVVVVADPDNAAAELVEEGVNGTVARSADPGELAAAILRINEGDEPLRASTVDWYRRNASGSRSTRRCRQCWQAYARL